MDAADSGSVAACAVNEPRCWNWKGPVGGQKALIGNRRRKMPVKMTPKQWVDGMALLARHKKNKTHGAAVQVLVRAILAGPDHKNRDGWSEPGDIIIVSAGRHGLNPATSLSCRPGDTCAN